MSKFKVGDKVRLNGMGRCHPYYMRHKYMFDKVYTVTRIINYGLEICIGLNIDVEMGPFSILYFELVDENPTDNDRFEKWDEKVNEEYNYNNDKFEVGDRVILKPSKKQTLINGWDFYKINQHLFDEVGIVVEDDYSNMRIQYNDNVYWKIIGMLNDIGFNEPVLLPKSNYELASEPDWDRFEKWDEKIFEEYDEEFDRFVVGDRIKLKSKTISMYDPRYIFNNKIGKVVDIRQRNRVIVIGVEFEENIGTTTTCRGKGEKGYCAYIPKYDLYVNNPQRNRYGNDRKFSVDIMGDDPDWDRFEKWEEKVNEKNNIYFMKKYKDYIKENIRIIDGYWYPDVKIPLTLSDIRIRLIQADIPEKIKFILLFEDELGYTKDDLKDLNISELENIISNEIPDFMISKKLNKAI